MLHMYIIIIIMFLFVSRRCRRAVLAMGVMPFVRGEFVFVLEGLVRPVCQ